MDAGEACLTPLQINTYFQFTTFVSQSIAYESLSPAPACSFCLSTHVAFVVLVVKQQTTAQMQKSFLRDFPDRLRNDCPSHKRREFSRSSRSPVVSTLLKAMDDIDDDDDDTVVGTCLHCNAPPPPRSVSSRGSRSSSAIPGGGGMVGTCTSLATTTKSNTDNILTVSSRSGTMPPANRVQVSCDDCRSFICDGE